MFNHVTRLNLVLLQVKGRSDLFLRLEVIKKAISLSMLLCAAPFGIIPICISQILYSQIAMYINTYYTRKLFGLSYIMQVKDFSKYLIFAFVACVPAYLMVVFDVPSLLSIIFGSVIALALYTKVLLWNDSIFKEMRSVIIAQLPRRRV